MAGVGGTNAYQQTNQLWNQKIKNADKDIKSTKGKETAKNIKNKLIKESDSTIVKAGNTGVNSISAGNEEKLSQKAQDYLKKLREKYGDYDFMVGDSAEDIEALSKSGSKEYSVIFTSDEIEKMANDEKYADEKMKEVEGTINMCKRICEEGGYKSALGKGRGENGVINRIGAYIDDNGNVNLFVELEKSQEKQKERTEKNREKHSEDNKVSKEHANKKNPYAKEDKSSVKRTTLEASSEEELIMKIKELDWNKIEESHSGDRINFSV